MNPVVRQTHRKATGQVSPELVEERSRITRISQVELVSVMYPNRVWGTGQALVIPVKAGIQLDDLVI